MKNEQDKNILLHGTAVLLRGPTYPPSAVFLRGLSGSGKSDLALRLIAKGASLISDDQVSFQKRNSRVYALCPDDHRGIMEIRGIGLLRYPAEEQPCPLHLVIDLVAREDVPRVSKLEKTKVMGADISLFRLCAFDVSAVLKVLKAMETVHNPKNLVT